MGGAAPAAFPPLSPEPLPPGTKAGRCRGAPRHREWAVLSSHPGSRCFPGTGTAGVTGGPPGTAVTAMLFPVPREGL